MKTMYQYLLRILTFSGIAILTSISGNAATIGGLIIDSYTKATIPGAIVQVEKQTYHAFSDTAGRFLIQDLPVGDYTITATCVGYENSYSQTISIKRPDEKIEYDIYLKPHILALHAVQVNGNASKETDASARNSEKNADNVINVVSAKTIEMSPDLTVANVVQRVSGVTLERSATGDGQYAILRGMDKRFNYTMVNGMKIPSPDNKNRFVPLDIFPSELLDRLEVSKSITANMEGDGIGGAVNMIMKDAPSDRQLTANIATGYNTLFLHNNYQYHDISAINTQSPNEKYGLSYPVKMKDFTTRNLRLQSKKANPNIAGGFSYGDRFWKERMGIMLAGSYQKNIRGNSNDVYSTSSTSDGQQITTHRFFSNEQTRLGLHAKFDMKLSPNHKLMWYNAYMDFRNAQVRDAVAYNSLTTRLRWNRQTIQNSTLKGLHSFDNLAWNLDWALSYGKATNETPDNIQINELIINNLTSVDKNDGASRQWEHNSDRDHAGSVNLTRSFRFENESALELSIGVMQRDKVRRSFLNEYHFKPYDETKTNATELIRGIDYNNFDEIKFSVASYGNLSDPLNYDATEKIGAWYGMEKLTLQKIQLIAGVRAEYTNQGYNLKFPTEGARNDGNQKYVDILPSASLKYSVRTDANLRLSYSRAINRPSFFEIVPYSIIYEDYKERGNPDLKHTKADNFDLRYEVFPHPLDQIMAGIFYKNIHDPIEFGMMNGFGQDVFYMPMNFGNANNYGVELDVIKYFGWFGIKANYTYTSSNITTTKMKVMANPDANAETNIVTEYVNQTRPLYGQAEHVANFSLLAKDVNRGWNAQLALAYTGDRLCIVSRYLDEDTWQAGYTSMDASVEKRFKSGLTLFTKASNLLNTPMLQYIKRNNSNASLTNVATYHHGIVDRKEYYGINISIGLKIKFH